MAKTKPKAEPAPAPAYMATRSIVLPTGQSLTEGEVFDALDGVETGTLEALLRIGATVLLDDSLSESAPVTPVKLPAVPLVADLDLDDATATALAQFTTVEELLEFATTTGLTTLPGIDAAAEQKIQAAIAKAIGG
jgi:hypothetical protein